MARLAPGTYNTWDGGLLIIHGEHVSWHPGERLDPMTIIAWSNEWPHGAAVRMHLRVWRDWWVRVA